MISKKLFYFKYTIQICILFIVLFGLKASSYKTENYSTNENVNKNVNLSSQESMTVNGKTFNYAVLSYEYVSSVSTYKYATKYIWAKVSDKYVVEIDIRDTDGKMTDDELKQILTMTFEENK